MPNRKCLNFRLFCTQWVPAWIIRVPFATTSYKMYCNFLTTWLSLLTKTYFRNAAVIHCLVVPSGVLFFTYRLLSLFIVFRCMCAFIIWVCSIVLHLNYLVFIFSSWVDKLTLNLKLAQNLQCSLFRNWRIFSIINILRWRIYSPVVLSLFVYNLERWLLVKTIFCVQHVAVFGISTCIRNSTDLFTKLRDTVLVVIYWNWLKTS